MTNATGTKSLVSLRSKNEVPRLSGQIDLVQTMEIIMTKTITAQSSSVGSKIVKAEPKAASIGHPGKLYDKV
jgi:hypothetical protein